MNEIKMHPCRECGTLCEVKVQDICGKLLEQITCTQPIDVCCLSQRTFTLGERYYQKDLTPYREMQRRERLKLVVKS